MATRAYPAAVALTLALFLVPFTANAQDIGDDEEEDPPSQIEEGNGGPSIDPPEFYPVPPDGPRGVVSDGMTDLILLDIAEARDICRQVPGPEYTVDCLSKALGRIAAKMPRGDYQDAKNALAQAARDLGALAAANRDRTQPQIRLRQPSGETTPALTPVRPEALASVNAAAAQILEEAETRLLRSAESSARRMVHYQRIAAAVGSAKVLLRSA
ncbi:hypothetical protein NHN26_07025 [Rhodovulum tesquicola]|uniref:hypothetical protein n=1 Tax=Rhodovulum tesquicola TaxID=540254 RepID=UPI002096D6FF|nr:hypothetical protein [Rhodovulum tesquicola]MCO8144974.1 hypothetical protein [Rhodovulum tesquicola]